MPKKIASAVGGDHRRLFKDGNKEKAKNLFKEKVDMQLKFNDVKLTPPSKDMSINASQLPLIN